MHYEPHHEKICLGGLKPDPTQTRHRIWLEMLDLENRGIVLSMLQKQCSDQLSGYLKIDDN